MTEAFPLYWPESRKRIDPGRRQKSRFVTGFGMAVREVVNELKLLGAKLPVVSTNVPLRRDGLPLASAKRPDDPGVAVYFTYKSKQVCFACDRWQKVEDNLWAVAKTINALRGIARWGTGDMLDAAFTGFTALPPPATGWRRILDLNGGGIEQAESKYRELARHAHPDSGGSHEKMAELNAAIAQARKELGA